MGESITNDKLMIILSDICTATCRACYGSCSPRNKNVMDESLMLRAIGQAKESGIAKYIGFSGGEPFLHYDLLKKGLKCAKGCGFLTAVCTNGFWGGWADDEIAKRIGSLPIDSIILSTDGFHEPFVSKAHIGRAMAFAKKAGTALRLRIGETKGGKSAAEYFNELGPYKYLTSVTFYPYLNYGRAKELLRDEFYNMVKMDDIRCAADAISIRYDGKVFPCAEFVAFDGAFSIGDLTRQALSEIIKDNLPLLMRLRETGGLRELAAAVLPRTDIPSVCGSGCEVCHRLLGGRMRV